MRISELGEFGLISLVQEWTRDANDSPWGSFSDAYRLTVDNGDDAAAATFLSAPVTELYTTDTMVDGIHFTAATTPWRDLGWKAIASNISDVAAMGGESAVALITLGLPPETRVSDIRDLYAGMTAICREYGARIVGGDMVRSPTAFITVALTGITKQDPMLRTSAAPGHRIAVSGPVGGSAGGLRVMLNPPGSSGAATETLIERHRRPRPHIAEGRILAAAGVRSAMDVSDGLADDLGKLCTASGVAATLWAGNIPAEPALQEVFPTDWLDLALYGGEDYVLLFTAPPATMDAAIRQLPPGAAVVGEITHGQPGTISVLNPDGSSRPRGGAGWDHFTG
ncbi:MAG: thiamine-phosphate kinase [Dehalococcoidia bacterium]|nr:thiamine-phosphate kinase [Dehalococcoidia bacterium]